MYPTLVFFEVLPTEEQKTLYKRDVVKPGKEVMNTIEKPKTDETGRGRYQW